MRAIKSLDRNALKSTAPNNHIIIRMATGNRKASVTSLVHSSIFSGLSILPEPDNAAVAMSEQGGYPIKTNRRERTSQTRLNFLSKSGAGSASSGRQASIESTTSSLLSPMSGDQHRIVGLQSRDSLVSLPGADAGWVVRVHACIE